MFYRYEKAGIGLFQYLKLYVNRKEWDYIRQESGIWLKKPQEYLPTWRSYFTERGNDRFDVRLKAMADNVISVKSLDNVVYADEYQVIVDVNK